MLLGEKQAVPTAAMALEYIEKGAIFKYIDHVHPNNTASPSGSGNKEGDIGTIKDWEKKVQILHSGMG